MKKALNVNRILLLSSLLLSFINTCLPNSSLGTSSQIAVDSNSDSGLNQLSESLRTSSQSSFEKNFYHSTNGALPMDREITIYVFSGEAKRLYYQIHNTKPEIALTVTPCESTIEWKLSFLPQRHPNKERKTRPRRRYKRRHNKYLTKSLLNSAKPLLLTSYVGNERTTYSEVSSVPGLYIIDFNSMGKDVSAKLFVSQHYPYPLLPNNPDIAIISVERNRVLISWHMSPTEAITPIEYCVSISSKKHFADNCLIESHNKDSNEEEYELDLLPSVASTSFAYWWGRTVKNMLRQTKLRSIAENNLRLECIGKTTEHLIDKLDNKRNNVYFIDVFARNAITNATSMYRTVSVTLVDTEPIDVKDNEEVIIQLNKTNNFTQLLDYNWNQSLSSAKAQQKLWLFINSCSGFGPISIVGQTGSHNSTQVLFRKNIFALNSIEIQINTNQTNRNQSLRLEISSSIASNRSVVFLINQKHNRFPFPLLPEDINIKVLATLTDCHSVTLAWNASPDSKVLYCIYKREAHNHLSTIEPIDDVCADNRDSSYDMTDESNDSNLIEKVLCKRYHKSSKRRFNNKIIQTIKDLSSGQKYVFRVMVTKYKSRTLAYEQIWVSTKPKYQCQ